MLKCPSCDQPTVSAWRKACLGPAGTVTCKACGAKLSVPWSAFGAALPALAALLLAKHLPSFWLGLACVLVGLAVSAVLHHKYVPLIVKTGQG